MKPIKLALLALAFLFIAPSVADAQYRRGGGGGYYQGGAPSAQLPGGFWNRQGRLIFGASLGVGHMSDDFGDIECGNCSYNALSGMGAGHIGGFLGPRFALMGEVQVNIQTVERNAGGDTTQLVHAALMIAGQYWILPQLWVKGGIGFANLQLERSYYGDGIVDETSVPENGLALMGAVGFELFSSRSLALDLEGRIINGSFDGIDNRITGATIGLGLSFY